MEILLSIACIALAMLIVGALHHWNRLRETLLRDKRYHEGIVTGLERALEIIPCDPTRHEIIRKRIAKAIQDEQTHLIGYVYASGFGRIGSRKS